MISNLPFDIWNLIFTHLRVNTIGLLNFVSKDLSIQSNNFLNNIPNNIYLECNLYQSQYDQLLENTICTEDILKRHKWDHDSMHNKNICYDSKKNFNINYSFLCDISIPFKWIRYDPFKKSGSLDIFGRGIEVYVQTDNHHLCKLNIIFSQM